MYSYLCNLYYCLFFCWPWKQFIYGNIQLAREDWKLFRTSFMACLWRLWCLWRLVIICSLHTETGNFPTNWFCFLSNQQRPIDHTVCNQTLKYEHMMLFANKFQSRWNSWHRLLAIQHNKIRLHIGKSLNSHKLNGIALYNIRYSGSW